MPEFDEPIEDYASFFKDEHSRNVTEHFEALVRSSGVDEQLNIETMTELRSLQQNVSASSSSRGWLKAGRITAIVAAVGLVALAITMQSFYFLDQSLSLNSRVMATKTRNISSKSLIMPGGYIGITNCAAKREQGFTRLWCPTGFEGRPKKPIGSR